MDRTLYPDEVKSWVAGLTDADDMEAIHRSVTILAAVGPTLGRPYVDTVSESRSKNMKELRVQHKRKAFRVFFAFDPVRRAVLLVAGDKRGDKRFYERMIPEADRIYARYLSEEFAP